jgi:hypothetical protein
MSVAIDAYPPAFRGNVLNLLFLDDAQPIRCAAAYLRSLDSPNLRDVCREYLMPEGYALWPFPVHSITERPDPWSLSERLYDNFSAAQHVLPTQRDVGCILHEKAAKLQPDIVALMIVDGLSYYDLPYAADVQPCLVNGVSTTDFGYREVIGKPTVSERLFSLGYSHQMGFTYFDVETNPLASELYGVFGSSQIKRVVTFKECLEHISAEGISHGFVQISAAGLDGLCHHHQDEPPVKHYIDEILHRFDALVSCLHEGNRNVLACLTADHGILWRQHLEGQWYVVNDLQPDDARYVRYIGGSRMRTYVLVKSCHGSAYSILRVPYITRKLRNNEWGVHGGISAWESIVPLIIRTT